MSIQFFGKNEKVSDDVQDYAVKKIENLNNMGAPLDPVKVEIERDTHHQKGLVYRVHVHARWQRDRLNAMAEGTTPFVGLDMVHDELQRQMRHLKEKRMTLKRHGRVRKLMKGLWFWKE